MLRTISLAFVLAAGLAAQGQPDQLGRVSALCWIQQATHAWPAACRSENLPEVGWLIVLQPAFRTDALPAVDRDITTAVRSTPSGEIELILPEIAGLRLRPHDESLRLQLRENHAQFFAPGRQFGDAGYVHDPGRVAISEHQGVISILLTPAAP